MRKSPKITIRKPLWLKQSLPRGPKYESVRKLLNDNRLHTVCREAKCPNIWECFSRYTATFMILGSKCTRNCRFCAIAHGIPEPPDPDEPERIAETIKAMQLRYAVITSVTRDDLPDGGAGLFAETICAIRYKMPDTLTEVLIPDFQGNAAALRKVVNARPDVLNHNIETVPRLYASVRPGADYNRSLALLKQVKEYDSEIFTKSGIMLGLGESSEEIYNTLQDIYSTGCSVLTLGQYLQPTSEHLPVERFVHPEEFDKWREIALKTGYSEVVSGPLVRSSYQAKEVFSQLRR